MLQGCKFNHAQQATNNSCKQFQRIFNNMANYTKTILDNIQNIYIFTNKFENVFNKKLPTLLLEILLNYTPLNKRSKRYAIEVLISY